MSYSAGEIAFKLSFQVSPIILTGGIASNIIGGMLPLVSITDALGFTEGLLSGGNTAIDSYFANFQPEPGGTIIDFEAAKYPFANQAVAANAIIANALNISLVMFAPAAGDSGYALKLATITALQATLQQHSMSGGTYTVATPSYYYTNCLLLKVYDVSTPQSKQPQIAWRWEFTQPLLTQQQAQQAQNSMMSKISGGVQTDGSLSGSSTIGAPQTLATPSISPAASGTSSAGVAGPAFTPGPSQ